MQLPALCQRELAVSRKSDKAATWGDNKSSSCGRIAQQPRCPPARCSGATTKCEECTEAGITSLKGVCVELDIGARTQREWTIGTWLFGYVTSNLQPRCIFNREQVKCKRSMGGCCSSSEEQYDSPQQQRVGGGRVAGTARGGNVLGGDQTLAVMGSPAVGFAHARLAGELQLTSAMLAGQTRSCRPGSRKSAGELATGGWHRHAEDRVAC